MATWEIATNRRGGGSKMSGNGNDHPEIASSSKSLNSDILSNNLGNGRESGENNGVKRKPLNDKKANVESKSKEIYVPTKSVGKLIGKKGVKIIELQIYSECKIVVMKQTRGEDTLIKLTGNKNQLIKAEKCIMEVVTGRIAPERPTKFAERPLGPVKKNFYIETPEVAAQTDKDVEEFRNNKNNINVKWTLQKEQSVPIAKPIKTFKDAFHNYPEILEGIAKVGFTEPTPIQCQSWPILMSGQDMIGIAQTGTGKTLAYLLPALIHIDGQNKTREERNGPSMLILTPTRELAQQIDREVCKFCYIKGLNVVSIYGGGYRIEQIKTLESDVDILISTPGRLNDFYMANKVNVKNISYLVLDEANRMLEMGFELQMRKVLSAIRPDRQTVVMSTSWPKGALEFAKSHMLNPIEVHVKDLDLTGVSAVTQTIHMMNEEDKFPTFLKLVKSLKPNEKIMCFLNKKIDVSELSDVLHFAHSIPSAVLHGDLDQCERERSVIDVDTNNVQILIATDLATRGTNFYDITHVVNFDFPRDIDEYVHRLGRVDCSEQQGHSISYFTRKNRYLTEELVSILKQTNQHVPEHLLVKNEKEKEKRVVKYQQPLRDERVLPSRGRFNDFGRLY